MAGESTPGPSDIARPLWAQPGITAVAAARAFLDTLRSRDTLVFPSADGDAGYRVTPGTLRTRGQGATVSASVVAASAPPPDLAAYHRGLGLEPVHRYHPRVLPPAVPLARLVLGDPELLRRIRSDAMLRRVVFAFKDRTAEVLLDRLGLEAVYCRPPVAAYETANDKLEFAAAGQRYGFETLAVRAVADIPTLDAAFRDLADVYDEGCILRLRRGAAGSHVYHARSSRAARSAWQRLQRLGQVLVVPYVPPRLVRRQIATHGIVTPEGFRPLAFTDQLVRRYHFRGGRMTHAWTSREIEAVSSSLQAMAAWLRDLGYVGAPAGVDGFLVGDADGLRFIALDPNIRMTATTMPWAVVATLCELANRGFVWQYQSFIVAGRGVTLGHLQRKLGADLLSGARLDQGGILPSVIARPRTVPIGVSRVQAILLGRDAEHLAYLCDRTRRFGLIVA